MSIDFEAMPKRPGPWGRRIVVVIVLLVVVGVVVGGLGILYFKSQVDPNGPVGAPVQVDIPLGSSTQRIAALLEEKGVVKNARNFRLYVRL